MGPKEARISANLAIILEKRARISAKGTRVPIPRVRKSEGFSCDVTRALKTQRVLVVMSQELADTRSCLTRLDAILDEHMNTLQVVPTSSKVVFTEPYVFTSKCIIREEVEKDRRRAEPSTF